MILKNEFCCITIEECMNIDNIGYGHIINPKNLSQQSYHKVFLITVILQDKKFQIALIGDGYSNLKQCAVLENNILTVLQNNIIVQIDITNGALLRYKDLELFGCNFELHKLGNDCLIYGEEYIVRLDNKLKEKWRFSGKDIFVSMSGKPPFELGNDSIKLYDFQDNFYEIDFSGQLIAKSYV